MRKLSAFLLGVLIAIGCASYAAAPAGLPSRPRFQSVGVNAAAGPTGNLRADSAYFNGWAAPTGTPLGIEIGCPGSGDCAVLAYRRSDSTYQQLRLSGSTVVVERNGTPAQPVAAALSGSATIDFGSVGANSCGFTTMTVTGAAAGDPVSIGSSLAINMIATARVTSADTVSYGWCNPTGVAIDPASGTYTVRVFK